MENKSFYIKADNSVEWYSRGTTLITVQIKFGVAQIPVTINRYCINSNTI